MQTSKTNVERGRESQRHEGERPGKDGRGVTKQGSEMKENLTKGGKDGVKDRHIC